MSDLIVKGEVEKQIDEVIPKIKKQKKVVKTKKVVKKKKRL
tara:strand:+ start:621 stop:743 length:123 start_codon:yes stop_codon:yes gene_type:complete